MQALLQRLHQGAIAFGLAVAPDRAVGIAAAARAGGFDWLLIEGPPSPAATAACSAAGLVPVFRDGSGVAVIGTPDQVGAADAIARDPAMAILFVAVDALAAASGIEDHADPRLADSFDRVAEACRRHGKQPGFGGVLVPSVQGRLMRQGFRFVLAGSEADLLHLGARIRLEALKGIAVAHP